jgi:outer membrane protein assembly factor BamB
MKPKHLLQYTLALLLLLFTQEQAIAQKAEQPDQTYELGARINETSLTQGGTLVVATNNGLVGIKPTQKELLFNFTDYGRVKAEELFFVPNAPYVIVDQSGFGGVSSKKAVIDYMSGAVLFSTEKNGWRSVNTCDVLMPENKLVVSGMRRAQDNHANAVAVYDLNTGNQESYFTMRGARIVTGRPLIIGQNIILPTSREILSININTGDIVWEAKVSGVNWMQADPSGKEIYTFEGRNNGDTRVNKISSTGSVLWTKDQTLKGAVSRFEILPNGLAVVSDVDNSGKSGLARLASASSESKIAFLSAANGEDLWDKAPKTKGYVQHFYIMDDGILFGLYEGGINKISFDGKTLFKRPLKTGENIQVMAETPQGLIYITDSDANIVNLTTGDEVWSKPLKYKRASAVSSDFDAKNNRYLISADGELHAIDANTGESKVLANSKFDGKESPTSVEVRESGILLTSEQNILMLDWEGNQKFHKYYRAPGKSAFGAILAGVTAVAAATTAMAAHDAANQNRNRLGQYTQRGQNYADFGNSMAAVSGASVAEMLKRFTATSATQDDRFILTKLDDGVGLVKVNKDSGEISKEIILRDKKPEYIVDEIGGVLYYQSGNSSIFVYDLK